ncbi:hypothetical protein ACJQWK_00341 [Exserohilum turcicum]|uniref:Calcineurin-like phosphoesterase domain-containing protein n=1 Tax=Exserohilum turcicum (strain 28A) TaxID=671987 RepID=R0JQP4_EXST2|nr:uncharacterized protein SETTUDRAFT_94000 [Exserohilum turcica Et28A]EOA83483.1 hypothetical protein SETTUDRAFT_94000 [Exserohilum turcica Et28A]
MAFFTPQFQIVSDLHLETPLTAPQYASFRFSVQADNLLLLGDIGLVVDAGLFQFLRRILEQNRGCSIFYVLGNHEPYRTTYEHAHKLLRDFEMEAKNDFGGRFKFLCRNRYDLNETITILGCTLWSAVQQDQESDIASRSTDLNSERGIQQWSLDQHREEHQKDLAWLNSQVSTIEEHEPHRQIVIATHYSPTVDPRANDPRHEGSSVSSNFVTDLSGESCWLSPMVKLWAFGHMHYSCCFRDEATGKLVVANQRGYAGLGAGRKKPGIKVKVVEAGKEGWEVVEKRRSEEEQIQTKNAEAEIPVDKAGPTINVDKPKVSILHRVSKRVQCFRGLKRKSS